MKWLNHTLKYMINSKLNGLIGSAAESNLTRRTPFKDIFRDYLAALGYNVAKEELLRLFREHCTLSDLFIECGERGKGNVWEDYEEQLVDRYERFCKKFEALLGSFTGKDITSVAGLCDIVLRAGLTFSKTGQPMRLVVQSRIVCRQLFGLDVGNGEHEVMYVQGGPIVICTFPHPNSTQQWLTNFNRSAIEKLDLSMSYGFQPFDGAHVHDEDRGEQVLATGHTDSTMQRWTKLNEEQQLRKERNPRLASLKSETREMNSKARKTTNFDKRLTRMNDRGLLDR